MFVISRLLRIWHEKLSERCLNGTTKRGSSKGRWNHKAQQGGYATCDAEGISQIGVGIHEIRGFWPSKEKKVVSLHGSLHSMDHFWSLINNSFFFPAMRLIHAFKLFCLFECAGLRECYAWGQTFCFFQRAGYLWRMEQAIRQPINVVCRMASTGKNVTDRASVLYPEYDIHNTRGPQMFNLRWEKLGCRFSRNSCQNMRVHAHCIPKQVVLLMYL